MALNKSAMVVASRGTYFLADAEAVMPPGGINAFAQHFLSGAPLPTGWEVIGHTSRENMYSPEFDGGETESKGSWEDENARTLTSPESLSYELGLLQFDKATLLKMSGGWETASGGVALPSTSRQFGGAVLGLIVDGTKVSGFRDPNCDIRVTGLGALSTEDYRELTITVSPKPSAQLVHSATGRTAAHEEFPVAAYQAPVTP